jgi:hypothetical protein
MCVTVTVVTDHSVALSRRSHLFSTMSSLHDVLVHDIGIKVRALIPWVYAGFYSVELSVKYVQKRKLRANFIKTGASLSQGEKRSSVVVLRQV